MTAIILVWNPGHWNRWNYRAVVERVTATGLHVEPWSVGRHTNIPARTEAWLLLRGRHGRGLIGHGVVVSEHPEPGRPAPAHPDPGPHHTGPTKTPLSVTVAFDAALPLGEQIALDVLNDAVPGVPWDGISGSGLAIVPSDEAKIRALWSDFGPPPGPDPTQLVPGTFPEGAVSKAEVNRYELSPEGRRACIAHHGTNCAACGFSFEITYGDVGRDFIHVHHVVPVSQLSSGYQLDPVTDLVPLCANCHAMAHHGGGTPRTVAELRRIIAAAGFLAGAAVSPEELEAEREARRMLGQ